MKLITLALAVVTLLAPGLAMAQTVECDGLAGGGTGDFSGSVSCGPRDYMYRIEHLGPQVPETLKIGTDDGNPANYTNLCLPAGWTFTITSMSLKHYIGFTPHGVVSPGSIGGCPYTMLFIGPLAPGGPEYIGFDHPGYPHDVEWQMAGFPPGFANWSDPVGGGLGPVHSPLDCDTTCDGTVFGDTIVAGTKDNFVGSEPSSPGADLIPLLNCSLGMTNFFDSALTNQCFGHTFIGTWDTTCCVVGGELCLKIAATGSIPTTDALAFAENGVHIWVLSLNTLQWFATAGADSSWDLGDTLEMCLDLGNLPPSNLGVTNVLMTLQDGDFDVKIQDDTEVDYLELRVETCCDTACPPGEPFCDSVTTDSCLVICPASDIVYSVWIKDSCGNPICDMTGTWLDFSNCEAQPCPGEEPFWPLVYPDSCHPATGQHFFTVDAGLLGCVDCDPGLFIDSQFCRNIPAKFLDTDGDLCVTGADWIPALPCNDYDCDGAISAVDQAIHAAHLDHCCSPPCPPGPPFCDSITTDSCLVICPLSDIVFTVTVKDSCGNPICDTAGIWLDLSQCNAQPCPGEEPNWPLVYPDSCNPMTGEHYFTVDAGLLVGADPCPDCDAMLVIGGLICKFIPARFLDINGDLCVTAADYLPSLPCNDYDCDGAITLADSLIHAAHLGHCCPTPCPPGPPFCDSTTSDPCLLICPASDIVFKVTVKDSCGNTLCDTAGTWLDFSQCSQALPCPGEEPDWPLVFPDTCDPGRGEHYFTVDAGLLSCVDCQVALYVDSQFCRFIPARFMDVNGDLCVDSTDWIPAIPCNDYNCSGSIDAGDSAIQALHMGHCCDPQGSIHGTKFNDLDCDGFHDIGEPPLSGWTINLYQGANLLASTTTDLNGDYWFMNLCPGKYVITETVQSGWVQTSPPTVSHQVDLLCGQTIQGLEFGNKVDTCAGVWSMTFQVAGAKDNFVGPPTPSSPGASLLPLLNCPFGMNNFFDSSMSNRCFGHTFSGFWDTTCCILGGTLCLRIAASGPYPSTDGIALAENGVVVWALTLNDLQSFATGGIDTVWSDGDTMDICLDLENLPPDNHGVTNVLATLKDGDFDIKFQDDTEIDWLELRVEICCNCCNHDGIRGDVNYDMTLNVADLTYLVAYLFQGGPPPLCFEEGDVNGDGQINVADLTYLVCYLFCPATCPQCPPPPPCP